MPKDFSRLAGVLIAGWILLCVCGASSAATAAPRYSVEEWPVAEDQLPQGSVITMLKTRDGYLWLGTLNGLVRFDGSRFTVFDESNTPGLNSSRIVYLFEDSQKNLWVGTETDGAVVIKDGQVKSLNIGRGRREGRLVSVCEDAEGAIWLYTADGELGRYRNGTEDVWSVGGDRSNRSRSMIVEKSGLLWVGWDRSLFSIDSKKIRGANSLAREEVVRVGLLDFLFASKSGGQWRLADGRVQKWAAQKMERDWPYPWRNGTRIATACEDRDGNLVVGTLGEGLFWFDAEGNATHLFKSSKGEGLSGNFVLSLQAEDDMSLWVGLDGDGLNRVKRQIFKPLDEAARLVVQSVCEDQEGGLWFSSNNQGVDYWKDGVLNQVPSIYGSLSQLNPRGILVDRKKRVWVATSGELVGLFQLQNQRFQPMGAGLPHTKLSAIHEDRAGQLWLGTEGGLVLWNEREPKVFTTNEGLSANIVRAIADDAEGNLWIGTERGGLNRLSKGQFTSFQKTNGFPSDNISSLHLDKDGVLWVGTFGSGLVRMQNGKWTHYTTREGLISNSIGYIIDDGMGSLWIGSNTGLMRVPKKALTDFANGAAHFIPCRSYGKRDGLPASECTVGSQPAACQTRDGTLWFPTIAGLASVNPSEFSLNTNPPPVIIESVFVETQNQNANGVHGKVLQKVVIPAGKEHLDIQYTSLNLAAPNRARFKYRLEGHEADWIDVGNRRVANYTKLPPGTYNFHVTACNEDGVWNPVGSSLAVIVLPPFWRTWWFLSAATLGLLGMIVGIVHFVSTQKLQRELAVLHQQQALEKERARIARDIHDQVGASLTQVSLLSEMVESDKDLPDEVEAHARQISQTARETSHALDEIVWTVNPSNDTLDGLINYICKHAQEYLAVAGLRYRLEVPSQLPSTAISPEARHNVFLAAKESVTNIVKHAKASEAIIRLFLHPNSFILEIVDNGRGPGDMNSAAAKSRNGLSNMRKRMEDIGGTFTMGPGDQGGTVIRLTVPIGNH